MGIQDRATHRKRDDRIRQTELVWRPSETELANETKVCTVFRKKLHELLYVDLDKNCSEYTQGKVDSDNVEIRYSLRPMT